MVFESECPDRRGSFCYDLRVVARHKAAQHDSPDAGPRLQALSDGLQGSISREEHGRLVDTTLIRNRSAAKEYSRVTSGWTY